MKEKFEKALKPRWWNPLFWMVVIMAPAGFVLVGSLSGILTGMMVGLERGLEYVSELTKKAVGELI